MEIFESLFDISYLAIVIGLGVRLLLEKNKNAKLFGIMAILLGFGDAFHLIPRVISHLSPLGFEGHSLALSWGQFITSITMTIFYLIYYHYYRIQSGDTDKKNMIIVYALAIIRIILVLLPQNNWGEAEGNYLFGIYRNIPFAIMGIFLIYLSYKERNKAGLKNMWLYILLSFLFYAPVVLWSQKYPVVGALMMPKTVAYLMVVITGYKFFIDKFTRINILGISFINLIMGLIGGVFYREFTKFYDFTGVTHLSKVHVHSLALGFILLLVIYLLVEKLNEREIFTIKKPLYIFQSGFVLTMSSMFVYGIFDVVSQGQNTINIMAISGISGLGHIILGVGLVWTMIRIFNFEKLKLKEN